MTKSILVVCITIFALSMTSRTLAQTNADVRSQIVAQYAILVAAESANNASTVDPVVAVDFRGVDVAGAKQDRKKYLADNFSATQGVSELSARAAIDSLTFVNEQEVVTSVTVTGTFKYRPTTAAAPQEGRFLQRQHDDWAFHGGQWQLANSQVLEVSQWLNDKLVNRQIAVSPPDPAQARAVIAQLNRICFPLRTAVPEGSLEDLAPLSAMIGNARIVGMGEGTHGTSEFFSLKDRIFRFLAQHMEFNVLAMEVNWTDGLTIDDYITSGRGDIRSALRSTFAVYDNQEVLDLIEWMRAFNAAPGNHRILHFVGIDMQSPKVATDLVATFYKRHAPDSLKQVLADYGCLQASYVDLYAQMMKASQAEKQACLTKASSRYLQTVAASEKVPEEQRLTVEHAARIAKQAATMYACGCGNDPRDAAMAENVDWVAESLYPHARIALWAHNGHIAAAPISYSPMGEHVRRTFGNAYFAIGFTFDRGSVAFNGIREGSLGPAADASSAAIFRQVRYPMFFLDLRSVSSGTPVARWLSVPRPMAMLGAVNSTAQAEASREYPIEISKAFDGLFFVEESHAAHGFEMVN